MGVMDDKAGSICLLGPAASAKVRDDLWTASLVYGLDRPASPRPSIAHYQEQKALKKKLQKMSLSTIGV